MKQIGFTAAACLGKTARSIAVLSLVVLFLMPVPGLHADCEDAAIQEACCTLPLAAETLPSACGCPYCFENTHCGHCYEDAGGHPEANLPDEPLRSRRTVRSIPALSGSLCLLAPGAVSPAAGIPALPLPLPSFATREWRTIRLSC